MSSPEIVLFVLWAIVALAMIVSLAITVNELLAERREIRRIDDLLSGRSRRR